MKIIFGFCIFIILWFVGLVMANRVEIGPISLITLAIALGLVGNAAASKLLKFQTKLAQYRYFRNLYWIIWGIYLVSLIGRMTQNTQAGSRSGSGLPVVGMVSLPLAIVYTVVWLVARFRKK